MDRLHFILTRLLLLYTVSYVGNKVDDSFQEEEIATHIYLMCHTLFV